MKYKTTISESFTVAIMSLLQKPMAASDVEKYSLSNIISNLPVDLRSQVENGIDAGIEIGLFAMEGDDIYITKNGLTYKTFLFAGTQSADAAYEFAKTHPIIDSILASIERDGRLTPSPNKSHSDEENPPPNEKHWSERNLDVEKQFAKTTHSSELKKNRVTVDGVFIMGGTHLSPEKYGLIAVKSAIDDTIKDAGEIIGNNETDFRRGIAAKAEGVHLHLIALQTAVLYVYAAKFLAVPRSILSEIYQGINTGFNKLLINDDGSLTGKDRPEILEILELAFRLYGQSLSNELNEKSNSSEYDGNFMNMGSTASLFSEAIACLCGVQAQLQASPIDKVLVEHIAAQNGIVYLLKLWNAKHITYSNETPPENLTNWKS